MPVGSLHNREVKLIRHVRGEINPEDFAIMETAIPVPGPHEVVVRNRWFRVSISTRLMAQEDAKAAEGIPFPPLNPGDTLADGAIGEVIQTGSACCLPVGSLVMHPFGWRENMPWSANTTASLSIAANLTLWLISVMAGQLMPR